jgi:hypothetical protein
MHIAITANFRSVLILLFCGVFSKCTVMLMEGGLAGITLHSTVATRTNGRHELPLPHTLQISVLFCQYTVHFQNLSISVFQRVWVRDLQCWIISWKVGEWNSKLRKFWESGVWFWYRSFPEQLIVAHFLKELRVIMEADCSSLSHKIPTFTDVNRWKKYVSNWKSR